jgi:enterochelin esterase-like enzyme
MPMEVDTFLALGLDKAPPIAVNGQDRSIFLTSLAPPGDAPYHPCPEAWAADDTPGGEIPGGEITSLRDWNGSAVFPDTRRDVRVYAPPGLDRDRPADVIIFNDGPWYMARDGAVRATRVLDTLLARGEIAPTVGVFVTPGRPPSGPDEDAAAAADAQRSFEYDSLTPDYGRFLLEELLPLVEARAGLRITDDPTRRTVCGISSGGICAFNAAWWFPEAFGRVISHCGSFVNIRGGHNVPYLVRSTPRKPIRIALQSGESDAQHIYGNWPLANRTLADALAFAGYDHRFDFGSGGHSLRHGGAIFADTLRWLWRPADQA